MPQPLQTEQHLGYRILLWTLAIALIAGVLISCVQVSLDMVRVSDELDADAGQTIATVQDSATQAVFSIDAQLASQVVDGLFAKEAVRAVRISHPSGETLAERRRPLETTDFRSLTDPIFRQQRAYRRALIRASEPGTVYGYLDVEYDTAPAARVWLNRAAVTFTSVIALAMVLCGLMFVVFHVLLTSPLLRIVRSVRQVEPDQPDNRLLAMPEGHGRDELGLWVNTTNNLLVAIAESQKSRREAEDRATQLTQFDKLTGLNGRDTFMDALRGAILEAASHGRQLSLYVLGLDDFKSMNEQFGFRTGDQLLISVGQRLTQTLGSSRYTVARLGSDQFAVLETELRDGFQAADTAEQILTCFRAPVDVNGQRLSSSATVGIALYPADAGDAERLLQSAEQTMALAKQNGRNHFQFYVASIDQEIRDRKQLEKDLVNALELGQFRLVYQPQINLESKRVIGAEALIRWEHPERGNVPPDYFIPVAETSGSIIAIGQWVLDQACEQAARWAADGQPIRMAVNLSAVQLSKDSIVDDILATLARHQIPAGRLELEVTETSFMTNLQDAVDKLRALHRAGVSIAVDDFGTGYSSLTYLKQMPVQHLKIDKQFIRDLLVNEEDTRIANTIIDLGRSLNLTVVAEGVETAEQEYYLSQRGCKLAQGYFFSKPLPADEFETFVQRFHQQMVENNL
ncbi:putative bifunctional diguanylate cyclase/phosphodiesterase [Marinobacter sp. C2H3]|uniref:putative bifunctional diguanylate cyclase/phosphodiesterase n=1 Tax=Marinobacter sp. C2H3 TaxID=3119003 RepID=UPI00300EB844